MKLNSLKNKNYHPSLQGFTLIEIVLVLIILGFLASIAIPSYFNWINKSKTAEVLVMMKNYRDQALGCLQAKDIDECSLNQSFSTSNFNYTLSVSGPTDINIRADLTSGGYMHLTYSRADGKLLTCRDCGIFANMCASSLNPVVYALTDPAVNCP